MEKEIDLSLLGLPPLPSNSSETIGTLLWAREVLQQHHATTYAVKDPKGIDELKPIEIGGVKQWVQIRGRNRDNPVLLYLHGGPGFPMIGWTWGDATFKPWEDYFTLVLWDQRQTGKSYYPANDETNPLTVEQFVSDTEEVIQYLQSYLNQDKLFLLGHSWGTVLGMHMVKRHPEWLHAYVGLGQVVNWMDNERVLYERVLHHAREQNEQALITKLEGIKPYIDPNNPGPSFAENALWLRRELSRLAGETGMHHMSSAELKKHFAFSRITSSYLSWPDISNALLGDEVALYRAPYSLTEDVLTIDLPKDIGSSFKVPIFFFSGVHDYQTPVTLSDQWFSKIEAPHKEIIHFQDSAHLIVNEEPGKMLVALVNKVLPYAQKMAANQT